MMYDLEFRNFAPDEYLESLAHGMLQHVSEIAPCGSMASAFLDRHGDGIFVASLNVVSRGGSFRAEVSDNHPLGALIRAEFEVQKEIETWRKLMEKRNRQPKHYAA